MDNEGYFVDIVSRYARHGEKLIVFMDVNSTIISVDSVSGKDMSGILLGTMLEFITLKPRKTFSLEWDDRPAIQVDKPMSFKQLAKKIAKDDKDYYGRFYTYENCTRIIRHVDALADVSWSNHDKPFSMERFKAAFDRYIVSLEGSTNEEGITRSWFCFFDSLSAGNNCIVVNSFGVDT